MLVPVRTKVSAPPPPVSVTPLPGAHENVAELGADDVLDARQDVDIAK